MERKKNKYRKSDISSIGEAMDELFNNYHLRGKYDESRLISSWGELMGKTIANRTGKIFIKKEVLFVEILSAPLKHELNLSKDKVVGIFEKEIGKGIINEIIFY